MTKIFQLNFFNFRFVPESSSVCVKKEESFLLQQIQSEHKEETQEQDVSEPHFHSETSPGLKHEVPETVQIKEEPEEQSIKQETEEQLSG